jgi:hypothetical protein
VVLTSWDRDLSLRRTVATTQALKYLVRNVDPKTTKGIETRLALWPVATAHGSDVATVNSKLTYHQGYGLAAGGLGRKLQTTIFQLPDSSRFHM